MSSLVPPAGVANQAVGQDVSKYYPPWKEVAPRQDVPINGTDPCSHNHTPSILTYSYTVTLRIQLH